MSDFTPPKCIGATFDNLTEANERKDACIVANKRNYMVTTQLDESVPVTSATQQPSQSDDQATQEEDQCNITSYTINYWFECVPGLVLEGESSPEQKELFQECFQQTRMINPTCTLQYYTSRHFDTFGDSTIVCTDD